MAIQEHGTIEEYEFIEKLIGRCLLSRSFEAIIIDITEAKEDET